MKGRVPLEPLMPAPARSLGYYPFRSGIDPAPSRVKSIDGWAEGGGEGSDSPVNRYLAHFAKKRVGCYRRVKKCKTVVTFSVVPTKFMLRSDQSDANSHRSQSKT